MFPLRDDVPSRQFPVVTVIIIGINVAIFLLEAALGPAANLVTNVFGVIPARLVNEWQNPAVLFTLLSSMYLHGGWAHLLGNMWYLWIFGHSVEDRLGGFRFVVFYTISGLIAAILQVLAGANSTIPIIGASGAIAGVLGAYLVLHPRARVATLVPVFYFIRVIWLPAVIVLGGWFVIQLLNGLAALNVVMQTGGTAWWAHIGGFIAGMVLLPIFRRRDYRMPPGWYDQEQYESRLRW